MLIDDESDWGSVNTNKPDNDPTQVNKRIRELLNLFDKSSYIAYTATPFANMFISDVDRSTGEILGDDLFPKDFMIKDYTSEKYNGPDFFFDPEDIRFAEGDETEKTDAVIVMDDFEELLPLKHKKDTPLGKLPSSLKEAIMFFRHLRHPAATQAG